MKPSAGGLSAAATVRLPNRLEAEPGETSSLLASRYGEDILMVGTNTLAAV